jgi:hypothetical protein
MAQSFAIDDKGDMYLTGSNDLAMVSGAAAVAQNCVTAMRAQKYEMQYAMQEGVPTAATAFEKYNPVAFEASARKVLKAVPGVVSVTAFSVKRVQNTLNYDATIQTIYGTTTIQSVL